MSMFVGAVMPRQNTAFASEETNVIVAPKDIRAAHISSGMRIVSSPWRARRVPVNAPIVTCVSFSQPQGESKFFKLADHVGDFGIP
jgi:hypothetical protein